MKSIIILALVIILIAHDVTGKKGKKDKKNKSKGNGTMKQWVGGNGSLTIKPIVGGNGSLPIKPWVGGNGSLPIKPLVGGNGSLPIVPSGRSAPWVGGNGSLPKVPGQGMNLQGIIKQLVGVYLLLNGSTNGTAPGALAKGNGTLDPKQKEQVIAVIKALNYTKNIVLVLNLYQKNLKSNASSPTNGLSKDQMGLLAALQAALTSLKAAAGFSPAAGAGGLPNLLNLAGPAQGAPKPAAGAAAGQNAANPNQADAAGASNPNQAAPAAGKGASNQEAAAGAEKNAAAQATALEQEDR